MISAIVVSYFSGELACRAIESLRRGAASSRIDLETVCVVNSRDEAEAALLREKSDAVIVPARNLGYGGGLNAGVDRARGDILLFSNPDVVFDSGSLSGLTSPLGDTSRRLMTGPALFWDEGETLRIPPNPRPTSVEFVRRAVALSRPASRLFLRDLRLGLRQAAAVDAGELLPVPVLSGAVMAVHRRTWNAVGPFNEAYALYYEENDWQERLRALGGEMVLAGSARVVHHFNQTARKEPMARTWFAESETRFLRAYHGERGERAKRLLEEALPFSRSIPRKTRLDFPSGLRVAVAVSPAPYFRPFALSLVPPGTTRFELPPDVRPGIDGEDWFARAVDLGSGRILDEAQLSGGG